MYIKGEPCVPFVMSLLTSHSIIGKPFTELIADNEEDRFWIFYFLQRNENELIKY
jgi:hypothetical protein